MLLRSGNIYDSDFLHFEKAFCDLQNPLFKDIWEKASQIYYQQLGEDVFNPIKHKEACLLFRTYIYQEIKKVYHLHN